jgi:hypothetical protein
MADRLADQLLLTMPAAPIGDAAGNDEIGDLADLKLTK